MTFRDQRPSTYEKRIVQAPGMMRHGPFPGLSPAVPQSFGRHPRDELAENKLAVQEADIERLSGDNEKLASALVVLRQELLATQQEIQCLKAHMRSIRTESDIQLRVLLDRIAKMEVDVRAGDSIRKDLQMAHLEAQSLVSDRKDLTTKIHRAAQELQKVRGDAKKMPEMIAELDSLRKEHKMLRTTFEYEKGVNIEQVEQLQDMEKNLVRMAREVQMLSAQIVDAEQRANALPHGGGYVNPYSPYLPPIQGGEPYMDGYAMSHAQVDVGVVAESSVPYISNCGVPPVGIGGGVDILNLGNGKGQGRPSA